MVVSGIITNQDSDNNSDIEYAEDNSENKSADDQLDDFIDGVF